MKYMDSIGQDESSFRHAFDPNHTLPEVGFKVIEARKVPFTIASTESIEIMGEAGRQVGDCVLRTWKDQRVSFDTVNTSPQHRGYGLAAYLLAAEIASSRGLPLETGRNYQSAGAKHVWERLGQAGIAEVVTPFSKSHVERGEQKYTGHYRISPHA